MHLNDLVSEYVSAIKAKAISQFCLITENITQSKYAKMCEIKQ